MSVPGPPIRSTALTNEQSNPFGVDRESSSALESGCIRVSPKIYLRVDGKCKRLRIDRIQVGFFVTWGARAFVIRTAKQLDTLEAINLVADKVRSSI